ncbi:hypothetical protein C1T31_09240 [Hanstruepera neustonica]|uniref:Uncharacterized protein n=1 Tax=Hanstruepera neustonica TaxID=1445657 RepID=A0A2K1DYQ0_9FLAO|nr:hypothetical protein C1T31_09240 [Hanstruepera neustonica]
MGINAIVFIQPLSLILKKTLFILLISINSLCFGQNTTELKLTSDSDTIFWKKIQNEKIADFNLPKLDSESEFVFRSWDPGSLLEIKKNNDTITGRIIYFVFEVWEENYKADTFVKEYNLPSSKSKKIYEFISNSGIQKIPSDKYIEEWTQGFDGITYIYELKEENTYSFKNFWTPKSQNGIKEAEFIIYFNKKISEIGELEKYGNDFVERIPFITYKYSGTAYAITKPPTKRELRKYKRERKKRNKKTRDNKELS